MKSWKFKVFFPLSIIILAILAKFILWDFKISSGKRVGNLTKISKKGKIIIEKIGETIKVRDDLIV